VQDTVTQQSMTKMKSFGNHLFFETSNMVSSKITGCCVIVSYTTFMTYSQTT